MGTQGQQSSQTRGGGDSGQSSGFTSKISFHLMNHIIINQITAALPTDLEQHFPGEQQHHCLPCPHRHHLRDGEGRQQTEGQVFLINKR